jgi:hypothetical protein
MYRLLIAILVASLALCGIAMADDDWDSNTDVIHVEDQPAEEAPAAPAHNHPAPADGQVAGQPNMGAYFGLGDNFMLAGTDGFTPGDVPPPTAAGHDHAAPADEYPHEDYSLLSDNGEGYSSENVYGPLWGVPADAQGLEGYDPATQAYVDPHTGQPAANQAPSGEQTDADSDNQVGRGLRNHKINRDDPNDW